MFAIQTYLQGGQIPRRASGERGRFNTTLMSRHTDAVPNFRAWPRNSSSGRSCDTSIAYAFQTFNGHFITAVDAGGPEHGHLSQRCHVLSRLGRCSNYCPMGPLLPAPSRRLEDSYGRQSEAAATISVRSRFITDAVKAAEWDFSIIFTTHRLRDGIDVWHSGMGRQCRMARGSPRRGVGVRRVPTTPSRPGDPQFRSGSVGHCSSNNGDTYAFQTASGGISHDKWRRRPCRWLAHHVLY